jgi:hypothetical protein
MGGERTFLVTLPSQVSFRLTRDPPRSERSPDKLRSLRRRSEYPLDNLIGIFIKAAAMAEYNSLRLP